MPRRPHDSSEDECDDFDSHSNDSNELRALQTMEDTPGLLQPRSLNDHIIQTRAARANRRAVAAPSNESLVSLPPVGFASLPPADAPSGVAVLSTDARVRVARELLNLLGQPGTHEAHATLADGLAQLLAPQAAPQPSSDAPVVSSGGSPAPQKVKLEIRKPDIFKGGNQDPTPWLMATNQIYQLSDHGGVDQVSWLLTNVSYEINMAFCSYAKKVLHIDMDQPNHPVVQYNDFAKWLKSVSILGDKKYQMPQLLDELKWGPNFLQKSVIEVDKIMGYANGDPDFELTGSVVVHSIMSKLRVQWPSVYAKMCDVRDPETGEQYARVTPFLAQLTTKARQSHLDYLAEQALKRGHGRRQTEIAGKALKRPKSGKNGSVPKVADSSITFQKVPDHLKGPWNKLSSDAKEQIQKEGRCRLCRLPGHVLNDCPQNRNKK